MTCPVLVSFPKSGRTWLRYMLTQMGADFELTHAGAGHSKERTFEDLFPFLKELLDRRIVFVLRDPRDTAVSGYFQASKRLGNYSGSMQAFLQDPHFGIEKIVRYNLLWMGKADCFSSFLAVRYEALHKNTAAELTRVVRYISGADPDRQEIIAAVNAAKFDKMRKLEESGAGKEIFGKALEPGDPNDLDSFKTRKGVVGGWRDELSQENIEYCHQVMLKYEYEEKIDRIVEKLDYAA